MLYQLAVECGIRLQIDASDLGRWRANVVRSFPSVLFFFYFFFFFFLCQFMCRRIIEREGMLLNIVTSYTRTPDVTSWASSVPPPPPPPPVPEYIKSIINHHPPHPLSLLNAQCSFTLESISQAIDYGLMYRKLRIAQLMSSLFHPLFFPLKINNKRICAFFFKIRVD